MENIMNHVQVIMNTLTQHSDLRDKYVQQDQDVLFDQAYLRTLFDTQSNRLVSLSASPAENQELLASLSHFIEHQKETGKRPHTHDMVPIDLNQHKEGEICPEKTLTLLEHADVILFVHDLGQGALSTVETDFLLHIQNNWQSTLHFLEKTIFVLTHMQVYSAETRQDLIGTIQQQIQYFFHVETNQIGWQLVNVQAYKDGCAHHDPEMIHGSNIENLKQFINNLTYGVSLRVDFSDERKARLLASIQRTYETFDLYQKKCQDEQQALIVQKEDVTKEVTELSQRYHIERVDLLEALKEKVVLYQAEKAKKYKDKQKKKARCARKTLKKEIQAFYMCHFDALSTRYLFPTEIHSVLEKMKCEFIDTVLEPQLINLLSVSKIYVDLEARLMRVDAALQLNLEKQEQVNAHIQALKELSDLMTQFL